MQNHVTAETARRLRDAGFPQPDTQFGQLYYTDYADQATPLLCTQPKAHSLGV